MLKLHDFCNRASRGATTAQGIQARVTITVPALNLLNTITSSTTGSSDATAGAAGDIPTGARLLAKLSGYGPIDDEPAAALCANAPGFQRILTHPLTGVRLAFDRTVYRPPVELARYVKGRDATCRFPGCARPADQCQIDHTINWEWGGPTDASNLACLCRKHHLLKHNSEWQVKHIAPGAILQWTSPHGRTHNTGPADTRPWHHDPRYRDPWNPSPSSPDPRSNDPTGDDPTEPPPF